MRADVSLIGFGGGGSVRVLPGREMPFVGSTGGDVTQPSVGSTPPRPPTSIDTEAALRSGAFWKVIGVFFLAGRGAVTHAPVYCRWCPSSPRSSSARAGTTARRGRSFALSVSYSLGMALVYTALGVAAGLAGEGLAASLQNPGCWARSRVALVVLSLVDVRRLRAAAARPPHEPADQASQRLPAGRFAGVFRDGRRVGAHREPLRGRAAGRGARLPQPDARRLARRLGLVLARAGMSVPLLLVGASAAACLPKAGAWMNDVKLSSACC
jgi:thiol:disulfide interchange protein DsbD